MPKQEIEVIRCVDNVLDRLGTSVRRTIVLHMRRESSLKRYELLQKPSEFINALRSVLGRASIAIEYEILETLETDLNIKHRENQDLLTVLIDLRERFDREAKIEAEKDAKRDEDTKNHYVYMDYMGKREK